MTITELFTEMLITGAGSLAFGIVYKVKKKRLPVVAAGGGVGWLIYRLLFILLKNIFLGNMGATVFITAFSELMARKLKAPVVVFLLPCLIPLVPGGSLYYAMSWVIQKDSTRALSYLSNACEAAFGIAAGIVLVSVLLNRPKGVQ